MHLQSLQLVNFKNYATVDIDLLPSINCFTGNNGAGKTNVLDAVHYLSMTKSYLNPVDRQNVRFDEAFFVIQGSFYCAEKVIDIQCGVKQGAKKSVKRNKKEYERLSEHIGEFPTVMISPYDRNLITEGSDGRRKWMDGIIAQFDKGYLSDLQRYNKVLEQRNALLKGFAMQGFFERETMEVWNMQLEQYACKIHDERQRFLKAFIPYFERAYARLGEQDGQIDLRYRSQLNDKSMKDLILEFERKDALSQYTNCGTHKDDLTFLINEHPIKKFGSQGQQKTYLIALRLAQFEWLKEKLGIKPILLLDDIFDKLDDGRVKKLMNMVSEDSFGQVLVTDTSEDRLRKIFSSLNHEIRFFRVNNNEVSQVESKLVENEG